MLILNLSLEGHTLYAKLKGNLTKKETYKINHYIIPYLQKNHISSFILDCRDLKKVDSEGRYVLLKTKIILKKQQGKFLLCNVKNDIKESLMGYRMRIQNGKWVI